MPRVVSSKNIWDIDWSYFFYFFVTASFTNQSAVYYLYREINIIYHYITLVFIFKRCSW